MKKPPVKVTLSHCRIAARLEKDTAHNHEHKLDQLKEMLPYYLERYCAKNIHSRTESSFTLHCPFHEDRTPSFTADIKKGTWLFKCFSCGRGGSIIDLHAESSGIDPRSFESIKSTAQAVGLHFDLSTNQTPAERKKWAQQKKQAALRHHAQQEEQENLEILKEHQRETLNQKLAPYLSDNWRADLWHSSPIWTETPEESPSAFLGTLFPPEAILWMGDPYNTGKEKHRRNFKTCQEWLSVDTLPFRVAAGTFAAGSFSRSKDNLETSPFIVIESDDIIGQKPTNADEREKNKALSCALAGYCRHELGLHLRAAIDSGNKSLHLWFDRPPPKALAAVRTLAPGLHIDTGLLDSCATAPLRMPCCIHEKTKRPAILLYLSPSKS